MRAIYRNRGFEVDDIDETNRFIYLIDVATSERIAVKLSDHKRNAGGWTRRFFVPVGRSGTC